MDDERKGTFTYTPEDGFAGDDAFTFHVNDGHVESNAATETIAVAAGTAKPSCDGNANPAGSGGGSGGGGVGPATLLALLTLFRLGELVRRRSRCKY